MQFGNTEIFRFVKHINFKAIRYRWQKLLLDYLSSNLPSYELPKFKRLKNKIYKEYNNGFYVYAKPDNKRSIDEMPDEDFIDMISYLMFSSEDFEDEDWTFDEEWEEEAEKFYNQGNTTSNNDFNDDDLPF